MKCAACGSSNLVDGTVLGGDEQAVKFVFAGRSRWRKVLGVGNRAIAAFACVHCGYLQQQVRFTDEDRARFVSFEGPQPSVVDEGGSDAS